MIDSHTHSKYSKHGIGEIEEIIISAIKQNIKILTITDHAPFPIDQNNRLSIDELKYYFEDINFVKSKYSKDIKILKGLEADFKPKYESYIRNLIKNMELDFLIGSVHSIFIKNKPMNIWDIANIHNPEFINKYFLYLEGLINSELFNSIGHPDAILRGGINEDIFYEKFLPLIDNMKKSKISYELNTSGLRKSSFNIHKNIKENRWNFPSKSIIPELVNNNISFTIGSDSHKPDDINSGIQDILIIAKNLTVSEISYYDNQKIIKVNIDNLIKGK